MDIWTHPASWTTLGFAAFLVNIRHVLMGASLGRKMGGFKPWQKYLGALVMADENWAMAEARARRAPLTPAYFAGLSVLFYVNWLVCSLAGALLGALTVAGAVATRFIAHHHVGYALALSAGVTIYVAASDLIPEVNREGGPALGWTVFAGLVLFALADWLVSPLGAH